MAGSTFGKLERDRAKRAKALAKREARQNRQHDTGEADPDEAQAAPKDDVPTEKLLEMIAELHTRFDDGGISYEDFEARKTELLGRLEVE